MADDAHDGAFSFAVDYAKSARSKCFRCKQTIDEKELRMGPLVQSDKGDFKYPQWHHFHCFEDGYLKKHPGALKDTTAVKGMEVLQFADMKKIKSLVVGGDSALETKAVGVEEKRMAQESKLLFARKEKLEQLSNRELADLLEHNNQPCKGKIFGGTQKMIDRLADAMLFGVLPKCPVCKTGDLLFSHGEYKCMGAVDEFAKCEYKTKDVERETFKIPSSLAKDHDFLAKYKFKERDRITDVMSAFNPVVLVKRTSESETSEAETAPVAVTTGTGADEESQPITTKRSRDALPAPVAAELLQPFQGYVVVFAGKLSKTQAALEALITAHGGHVTKSSASATVCVCTPEEATGNGSKKGQDAVNSGVLCVKESWITDSIDKKHRLTKEEIIPYVLANPLKADATRDVKRVLGDKLELERVAQEEREKLEEKYTEAPKSKKHQPEATKTVVVKDGAAVEPDSGLVETAHIYKKQDEWYTTVMNMTDVTTGKNSFYILQLIELDNKAKWCVFRKWGRIGDSSIGGTKLTEYPVVSAAEREFDKVFFEKTGNPWSAHKSGFKKQYGKFLPIEIDFSANNTTASATPTADATSAAPSSKLDTRTQDFVRLIFDVKAMNDALMEMQIDTQKMPLGKLSKNTIGEGFRALKELQEVLQAPPPDKDDATAVSQLRMRIVSLTNRFYNYIPHVMPSAVDGNGTVTLPLLDTIEKVTEKSSMLSQLQDLEVSSKLLSAGNEGPTIDSYYDKLHSKLTVVERGSDEFRRIDAYIQNTHGHTHTIYNLELVDLWQVEREGESERFAKHADNPNRMLLWHGSRLTNWGGILSQGLRIAPPEAPSTGYMFGKGVYFADMSSKSANYCFTTSEKNTGILMLCEVALGEMKTFKRAFYVDGLEKPYQSTKGVGQYTPDPKSNFVEENGCVVPVGKGIASGVKDTSLLYNEFIVYDVAQVRTRYVMRMNFKYHKKAGTFF